MHVISLRDLATRDIVDFGSAGFGIVPVTADGHVVVTKLSAGGRIGRHPAVVDQCLVVVEGEAEVSGEDGTPQVIRPGSAVLWAAGEGHETRTHGGLTALIVEGAGLVAALR